MFRCLCLLLLISTATHAQKYTLHPVETGVDASFRGMSIPNDSVAWVSGSKGHVLVTTNSGADWTIHRVPGFDKADFRTLHAFDNKNAIIANAGSPAVVLRTADGGTSWKQVYGNTDSAAFIDGIAFWDSKHGIIYGDPIGGRLMLLTTDDGGLSWKELPIKSSPVVSDGEASFAASGTAISHLGFKTVLIATGGTVSRILISGNRGKKWKSISTPILQGKTGAGIFSISTPNEKEWFIAGGDYTLDTLSKNNFYYTTDRGKTWQAPEARPRGYRECLLVVNDEIWALYPRKHTIFAIGPTGIDASHDRGKTWQAFSDEKLYHTARRSPVGNFIIVAGGKGKLAMIKRAKE
ncbi:MAG: hypothetical protein KF744_10775 [Taibaiella sp.]|nr:hypothetical protein [Taibaiella sp.]